MVSARFTFSAVKRVVKSLEAFREISCIFCPVLCCSGHWGNWKFRLASFNTRIQSWPSP